MDCIGLTVTDIPILDHTNGTEAVIDADFYYAPNDPYAIHVTFRMHGSSDGVTWILSRESFAAAIRGEPENPHADARLQALPEGISLTLCSPTGYSSMLFDIEDIAYFLSESYELVPAGEERMDSYVDDVQEFLYRWPDV